MLNSESRLIERSKVPSLLPLKAKLKMPGRGLSWVLYALAATALVGDGMCVFVDYKPAIATLFGILAVGCFGCAVYIPCVVRDAVEYDGPHFRA